MMARRKSSPRYTPREIFDEAARNTSQVYKGYLIQFNALHSLWNISKGGHHIGATHTLTAAKKAVDMVADPVQRNPRRSKRRASPKQLAARKRFAAMVEARAKKPRKPTATDRRQVKAAARKSRKNPLPMFPIYARKSTRRPWSLLAVTRTESNARAVAKLVNRHHGLAVKVDRE